MRTRVPALAAVLAFAVAVALVAGLAGRGRDRPLQKLPVAARGGDTAADAAAAPATAMAERRAGMWAAFGMEYRVEGDLPALPGTAPAYRLGATTTAARVSDLAAALGTTGDVAEDADGWVVRDGSRELRVQRAAGLPWFLGTTCPERPVASDAPVAPDIAACSVAVSGGSASSAAGSAVAPDAAVPPEQVAVAPAPCPRPPPGAGCAADRVTTVPATSPTCAVDGRCTGPVVPVPPADLPGPAPVPYEPPPRPADLPSRAEAERLAQEVLTRIGVPTDGLVVDDAWSTWEARVELRVGGLPVVGLGTGLGIGPRGEVVHAYGALAAPDLIGDYPLAGTDAGLKRLKEGFGPAPRPLVAGGDGGLPPGAEPAVDTSAGCSDPTVLCEPATTLAPVVQTITGAHLVLLHLDAVLVPAYVFELSDGGETFPAPAVTDEWLDLGAAPAKG